MAIKHGQAGVTLIELIVVVAIFGLVSSVLLFNYSDFSSNVSVRNLSQEIGLAIRKAQSYATSVRTVDAVGTNSSQYPAYGINFSLENGISSDDYLSDQKQFILFSDLDQGQQVGNNFYDSNGKSCGTPTTDDECVEGFLINTADRITQLCTNLTGCGAKQVNIVFRRPSPDADICVVESGSCRSDKADYASIVIESAKGLTKTVTVWNTGQISVQ
jgi:prepilin-type N-terminal cleavage/methylation domain-containing protein